MSTRNRQNRHLQQVNKWLQEESGKLEERALESRFLRAEKGQFFEVLSICVDCGRQTDK